MKDNKNIFHISGLIASFLAGTLSPEGEKELEDWKNGSEENRLEFDRICSLQRCHLARYGQQETAEAFRKFVCVRKRHALRRRIRYACCASVAALLCLGGSLLFVSVPEREPAGQGPESTGKGSRPLLTLASGEKKFIAEDSVGLEDAARIYASGRRNPNQDKTGKHRMNNIEVPAMCDFIFTLPDGTRVWMNASSQLTYPEHFDQDSRTVYAKGEVYLEVSRDENRPFQVILDNMTVKVLGTSFNVRSYEEEGKAAITLAEGRVRVSASDKEYTLRPGQQLAYDRGTSDVQVEEVNLDEVIAWKKGYYVFRNSCLADVAFALKCWYGVEIGLEGKSTAYRYTGVINKEESLEVFLERLRTVSNVKVRYEGNKVSIY